MFTKFNRVLLASGLVLTSLVGFGSSAFADTITVENNDYVSSSFTPATAVAFENTSSSGVPTYVGLTIAKEIGTLKIASNGQYGFTVKVNGDTTEGGTPSSLIHEDQTNFSGKKIAFKLAYVDGDSTVGTAQSLTNTPVAMDKGQENFSDDCSDAGGCTRSIRIVVEDSALTSMPSGTYTATVAFTVSNDSN